MPYVPTLCGMYPVYPGGGEPLLTVLSENLSAVQVFTLDFQKLSCQIPPMPWHGVACCGVVLGRTVAGQGAYDM